MNEDKCTYCGTPASPGARYCESCGSPLPATSRPPEASTAQPAPSYAVPGAATPYQGVAIRFVQFIIDAVIYGIISSVVTVPFSSAISIDQTTGAVSIGPVYAVVAVLSFIIELLYFTLLLGYFGQSVGMMAVKIKVVREDDFSKISYGAAFVRTILLIIDAIPFVIPYLLGAILIWTSDKKQRLGDRVAHTVVIKV